MPIRQFLSSQCKKEIVNFQDIRFTKSLCLSRLKGFVFPLKRYLTNKLLRSHFIVYKYNGNGSQLWHTEDVLLMRALIL